MAARSKKDGGPEDSVQYRRTQGGTMHTNVGKSNFYSKHGIVSISDRDSKESNRSSTSSVRVTRITRMYDGTTRFPKLEECAHFHYEVVELGRVEVTLVPDNRESSHHHSDDDSSAHQVAFLIKVFSNEKTWLIRRTYDDFRTLDRQLHRCIFDRKYSSLPELRDRDVKNDTPMATQHLLGAYINRLCAIFGNGINCGPVLGWFEMDNRGHRLIVGDDSAINTPAIAAAHVVKRYTAQAPDELSFEVDDMISIIDMPPPTDTTWWRGKKITCTFEVGFFPSECVVVIGDTKNLPETVVARIPLTPQKPVLRRRGKLISFLRMFFTHRPARNTLKRTGIVKERVFGCDLGEHLLNSGHDVPLVLKSCAEVIESHGIVDGIYRLSGVASNTHKLRNAFDEDQVPDLTDETYLLDIHSISSLLKMYFRELPNPLLTYQLYDKFAEAVKEDESSRLFKMYDVIQQLPPPHYRTTEFLMRHLAKVAEFGHETGMHHKNLAIVWAPNLLRSKELETSCTVKALQGVSLQAVVTEFLIRHVDLLFSDQLPAMANGEGRRPRPKSLAMTTPTKLLSLEEARVRAQSVSSAHGQKYIEVGGGPDALPEYHAVIDVPGKKKKKGSQQTTWRSIFSRGRTHQFKQKEHVLPPDNQKVVPLRISQRDSIDLETASAVTLRKLRSADSLLLEGINSTNISNQPGHRGAIYRPEHHRNASEGMQVLLERPPWAPKRSLSFEPENGGGEETRLSSLGESGHDTRDSVFLEGEFNPSPIKLSTTEELLSELEGRLQRNEVSLPEFSPDSYSSDFAYQGFHSDASEEMMTRSLPAENLLFGDFSVKNTRSVDPPPDLTYIPTHNAPLPIDESLPPHQVTSLQADQRFSLHQLNTVGGHVYEEIDQRPRSRSSSSSAGAPPPIPPKDYEGATGLSPTTSGELFLPIELAESPGASRRLVSRLSQHMDELETHGVEGGEAELASVEGLPTTSKIGLPFLQKIASSSVSSLNSFHSDECRQVRYLPETEQAMSDDFLSGGSDLDPAASDVEPSVTLQHKGHLNKTADFPFQGQTRHLYRKRGSFSGQMFKSHSMPSVMHVGPSGAIARHRSPPKTQGSRSLDSVLDNADDNQTVLVYDGRHSRFISKTSPKRKRGARYTSAGELDTYAADVESSDAEILPEGQGHEGPTWTSEQQVRQPYSPSQFESLLTDSGSIHIGSGSSQSSTMDTHLSDPVVANICAPVLVHGDTSRTGEYSDQRLPRDETLTEISSVCDPDSGSVHYPVMIAVSASDALPRDDTSETLVSVQEHDMADLINQIESSSSQSSPSSVMRQESPSHIFMSEIISDNVQNAARDLLVSGQLQEAAAAAMETEACVAMETQSSPTGRETGMLVTDLDELMCETDVTDTATEDSTRINQRGQRNSSIVYTDNYMDSTPDVQYGEPDIVDSEPAATEELYTPPTADTGCDDKGASSWSHDQNMASSSDSGAERSQGHDLSPQFTKSTLPTVLPPDQAQSVMGHESVEHVANRKNVDRYSEEETNGVHCDKVDVLSDVMGSLALSATESPTEHQVSDLAETSHWSYVSPPPDSSTVLMSGTSIGQSVTSSESTGVQHTASPDACDVYYTGEDKPASAGGATWSSDYDNAAPYARVSSYEALYSPVSPFEDSSGVFIHSSPAAESSQPKDHFYMSSSRHTASDTTSEPVHSHKLSHGHADTREAEHRTSSSTDGDTSRSSLPEAEKCVDFSQRKKSFEDIIKSNKHQGLPEKSLKRSPSRGKSVLENVKSYEERTQTEARKLSWESAEHRHSPEMRKSNLPKEGTQHVDQKLSWQNVDHRHSPETRAVNVPSKLQSTKEDAEHKHSPTTTPADPLSKVVPRQLVRETKSESSLLPDNVKDTKPKRPSLSPEKLSTKESSDDSDDDPSAAATDSPRRGSPTKRKVSVRNLKSRFENIVQTDKPAERNFKPLVFPKEDRGQQRYKSLSPGSPQHKPMIVRSQTFHSIDRPETSDSVNIHEMDKYTEAKGMRSWEQSHFTKGVTRPESADFTPPTKTRLDSHNAKDLAGATKKEVELPKRDSREHFHTSQKAAGRKSTPELLKRDSKVAPRELEEHTDKGWRYSVTGWGTCDELKSITTAAKANRLFWTQRNVTSSDGEPSGQSDDGSRSPGHLSSVGSGDGLPGDDPRGHHQSSIELNPPRPYSTIV